MAPAPLAAKPPTLNEARSALAAAQRQTALHRAAAARAKAEAGAAAAKAAGLAQQQVAAAAALRQLEDRTAQAAESYAALQSQSRDAAVALRQGEAQLAALLPVMQRLAAEPAASLLAVPQAPADAVRGIIVLQGIAAAIGQRAAAVKRQSALVAGLMTQAQAQQNALAAAAATQSHAEASLSIQIANAKAAEMANAQTALNENAAAIAADGKLRDLHDIVDKLLATPTPRPPQPLVLLPQGAAGSGGAPVAGAVVQKFGDSTAAGPAQGVSYRAAPGARVVTPCAGAVKFADQFQSYGLVVIVDCGARNYVVLSGLQHLDVDAGENLARRQPVGTMAGYNPADPGRQPVLYVEFRHNGTPVDPAGLLAGGSG